MDKSQQTLKKGQAYHHGDLRNALVEAGLKVLAKEGAEALNLREVARRAGVSHAAPYRHFADKQALIEAIAEDGFHRLWAYIEQAAAKPAKTSSQRLIMLGQAYVQFALLHSDHFRIMFTSVRAVNESNRLYVTSKAGFHVLIAALQAGQASGELVKDDPVEQAKLLWVIVHGVAVLLIDNQFADARVDRARYGDALVKRCVEQVLVGLRARA
jgi:AcrR family transcriptional regulator